MSNKDSTTENKILEAAREVFIQKGMHGILKHEIAERAGIKKALLHYYYRSKEKLFLMVFKMALSRAIPKVAEIINADIPFFDNIRIFVSEYGSVIYKNQFIPLFVLSEINRNPDALVEIIRSQGINTEVFLTKMNKEIKEGRIRETDMK